MALIKCPDCQKDVSDKADKCPYCGYPINPSSAASVSTSSFTSHINKPAFSKKQIFSVVTIVLILCLGIVLGIIIPKQRAASYEQALTLLENGNYEEGQKILLKNPNYKDIQTILEEIKYEPCAYSAVNALKKILKNPDSVSVYTVDLYGPDPAVEDSSDSTTIIDNDHPFIVLHYAAQNGFGGNTTGYFASSYDSEDEAYQFVGYTDSLNLDDLDKDDDDYFIQALTVKIVELKEENCEKIGAIDVDRLNKVLKNNSYTAVKIIS
mgnify:CR=1 FL=1